jgi:hypothetical protein
MRSIVYTILAMSISLVIGLSFAFFYFGPYSNDKKFNELIKKASISTRASTVCKLSRMYYEDYGPISKDRAIISCKASYVANTKGVEGCLQLDDNEGLIPGYTESLLCLSAVARNPKSLDECHKIPHDNLRDGWCYVKLAEKKKDASICKYIPDRQGNSINYNKIGCIDMIAKENNNIDACNNHELDYFITQCQDFVNNRVTN